MPLLDVRDLHTQFTTDDGVVRAVDGVSFSVDRGEVLGIVGESGSGKSVTGLSILRLVPSPPGKITAGEILFEDDARGIATGGSGAAAIDLLKASDAELRRVRGARIAMIFQDPMTSLNPYLRVGVQLGEVLEVHAGASRAEARAKSIDMMRKVGIPAPETRVDDYPHQMSGGMRQRVMIAMALLGDPALLIADEPTTALDVTIQAQILDLIVDMKRELGLAVVLITHDLGVVAKVCDRVAVMYAGRVVEEGPVDDIFARPAHPYTIGLTRSIPRLDEAATESLVAIPGAPPSLAHVPRGCPFHPRCAHAIERCLAEAPLPREVGPL
ncbi:MAG TPA: ABC transporter ATP-binding protein, partial [Byssovorax sp.]